MEITPAISVQLIERLSDDNCWWTTGRISDEFGQMKQRPYTDLFYPMVANQAIKRAVILMGPRRVGKTVMIFHSIARLLQEGVDPKKIIYLSIDTPIYNGISLEELFNRAKEVTGQVDERDGFYVFFDEIQYLKDWEVHLKSMVDSYRGSKFVASGSAAAALKMKSNESGAGRFTDFMLPPLTFYEYITMLGLNWMIIPARGDDRVAPYDTGDITTLNRHFIEYMNFGGYPEVVFSEGIRKNPRRYVRHDIVDKVLLRDLPSLYGIADTQELNHFFVYIAWRSGLEFSYETMAQDSGIRKETIKKYIEYLQAAFLIKIVHKTDQNARRMQRVTTFKIYLTNTTLRCALFSPFSDGDDMIGGIVETSLFSQLLQEDEADFYYSSWRQGRDHGEVDIVMLNRQTQRAQSVVEVKWADRYVDHPNELKSLLRFVEENSESLTRQIICTTKSRFGRYVHVGRQINFIPTAIYAYWVSSWLFRSKSQF